MEEQFVGKKVSWSHLEDYLKVHKATIVTYLDQLEYGAQTKASIETNLPRSFWLLHQAAAKIIRENNIGPKEEESKVDQLQFVVKTVMKL